MMKRYINKLGKILLASTLLIGGSGGLVYGQGTVEDDHESTTISFTNTGDRIKPTEEVIYALPNVPKNIYFQYAYTRDNIDGFISWRNLSNTQNPKANLTRPQGYRPNYRVGGAWEWSDDEPKNFWSDGNYRLVEYQNAFAWFRNSDDSNTSYCYTVTKSSRDNVIGDITHKRDNLNNSYSTLASTCYITYQNNTINGNEIIECSASSVLPTSWTVDRSRQSPELTVIRRYQIKNGAERGDKLKNNREVMGTSEWLINVDATLPEAYRNNPGTYFIETPVIHTPMTRGTSYRLAERLTNYYVPSGGNYAEAGQVRWRAYDENGYPSQGNIEFYGENKKTASYTIQEQKTDLNLAANENRSVASILNFYFNYNEENSSSQQKFYLTAEVAAEGGDTWYPVSLITVYLEPHSDPMTQEELCDINNEDDPLYQRRFSYINKHYTLLASETFDGEQGEKKEIETNLSSNNNYRSTPFTNSESFYAYTYPSENRDEGRKSAGRGEYGLYRTLNYEGVSQTNYTDYFKSVYNHEVIDRNKELADSRFEEERPEDYEDGFGYFLYVDAADEAGVITKLKFNEDLCPNTRLLVTAWVCNLGGTYGLSADVGLTFKGVKDSGEEEILNKFYTGAVKNVPETNDPQRQTVKWQQIYFYFNYSATEDTYESYVLELANNCRHSGGADYAIDDIRIYRSLPDIRVERINDCDATTLEVTTDVLTLFANMNWDQDQPVLESQQRENEILGDYTTRKYRYGLMGLKEGGVINGEDDVYSGNFYFAFLDNFDPETQNRDYDWVAINKDALGNVPEAVHAARVSLTTKLELMPRSAERALIAERYMNIQAMIDYNSDYQHVKESYDQFTNKENPDAEFDVSLENGSSFKMTVTEAMQFLNLSDDGSSQKLLDLTALVDNTSSSPNVGSWDDNKLAKYTQNVIELYHRLHIPRIRYPWLSSDGSTLHISTIDVDNTDLKCFEYDSNGTTVKHDGKYHVMIFTAEEVAGVNTTEVSPVGKCKLVSPFQVQGVVQINIITGTQHEAALCVGNQRQLSAYLLQWEEGSEEPTKLEVEDGYIFDWYLGPMEGEGEDGIPSYSSLEIKGADDKSLTLKEALSEYRNAVNNPKGVISVDALEEWSSSVGNIKEVLIDLIQRGLLQTGKFANETFTMIVRSDEIVAMPYVSNPADQNIHYCTEESPVDFGEVGDHSPLLYPGFNNTGDDTDLASGIAYLRLGLLHLESGKSLTVPVRSNVEMADDATSLREGSNTNITWTNVNTGNVTTVGTITALNVTEAGGTITFQWNNFAKENFKEGIEYHLNIPFVQYDGSNILSNECDGLATLAIKIVPEYLTWSGDANGLWYNDNNWEQSTKGELYKDGDAGTSTDDANGTDDIKNAFSPLYFTKVTVNPEKIVDGKASVLPLREEKTTLVTRTDKHTLNFGADGMNLDAATDATSKSGVTPNIQYDMAVDGEITDGIDKSDKWSIVPYYGNKVDQIYFKPGAQLQRQQELKYNTARVEFEMDKDAKYWLASPLKDVYAGDMYAPKGTGRQTTYAFDPISYSKNAPNSENDRQNPSFYQKAWDKGVNIYTNADGDLSTLYSVVKSNWSVEYNDVNVPYALGKGFYASVEDFTNDENKALVRLPKEDVSYTYEELKTKAATSLSKTNGGKLADGAEITVTLSSDDNASDADGDGKHFLLGNPYMYPLSLESFFAENTMLANKVWTLNGGTAIVGTPDLVNGWNTGESLTEIPPMQAFFVELKDGLTVETTTQTVTFSTSMMKSDDETSRATLRSSITASHPVLRLTAEKGEKRSIAFLTQRDDASNTYESDKDAITLLDSELTEIPQVYTIAGDRAAGVNAVKTINNIPLGVYTASDKDEVALTIEGISNLPAALYLYDAKTKENKVLTGDSYTLNLTGATHGRYFLRSGDMPTGNEAIEGNNISIYSVVRGEVIVSATEPLKQIQVVAPSGQVVRSFFPRQAVHSFNLPQGIYIIRAESQTAIKTVKLQVR